MAAGTPRIPRTPGRKWAVMAGNTLLVAVTLSLNCAAMDSSDALDGAYRSMYALNFESARILVAGWEAQKPEDPRGPVAEAANILFAEFSRLGILELQFLAADRSYTDRRAPQQ